MVTASADTRDLARAYLFNEENKGIFERARDFAERARHDPDDHDAAVEYVAGDAYRAAARAELDGLVALWGRHLRPDPVHILDAGCGPGVTTRALAERYPTASVLGIDIEDPALDLARHHVGDLPNAEVAHLRLEELGERGPFDLIQCRMVLEHVDDPRAALTNMVRSLAPGGVAYVETPNYTCPWEPHVKLPMLPHSPRWLLEQECRLAGRDAGFVGHLNLELSRRRMFRWARDAAPGVVVRDLMAEKAAAVFAPAGGVEPRVASRAALTRRISRRPVLRRAATLAFQRLPIAPSVIMLVIRGTSV